MHGIELFQMFHRYVGGDTIQFAIHDDVEPSILEIDQDCWSLKQDVLRVFINCFVDDKGFVLNDTGITVGYKAQTLLIIKNNLKIKLNALLRIKDLNEFISELKIGETVYCSLNKNFLEREQIEWQVSWKEIIHSLVIIIEEIARIVEFCINNKKTLWVFPV